MEPVTTVTTAWTIAKTAGEISKKLYEFGKSLKDREAKQQLDEIVDKVRELKQSASELVTPLVTEIDRRHNCLTHLLVCRVEDEVSPKFL
jgi:uncharacterized coiled-coil DUF342 family protein